MWINIDVVFHYSKLNAYVARQNITSSINHLLSDHETISKQGSKKTSFVMTVFDCISLSSTSSAYQNKILNESQFIVEENKIQNHNGL